MYKIDRRGGGSKNHSVGQTRHEPGIFVLELESIKFSFSVDKTYYRNCDDALLNSVIYKLSLEISDSIQNFLPGLF